jgi:hypothetical protein
MPKRKQENEEEETEQVRYLDLLPRKYSLDIF